MTVSTVRCDDPGLAGRPCWPLRGLRITLAALAVSALAIATMPPAHASQELAAKSGCVACHAADRKMVGPSYKQIAERYKGQADAPALLAERVRKGGKGVWGQVAMPPTDPAKVDDATVRTLVAWLLKAD